MNKTKIEWVRNPDGTRGYTWNPITGCLNHIDGRCKGGDFPCYAYKLAHGRLMKRYLENSNLANIECKSLYRELEIEPEQMYDPFYPRFWPERLDEDLGICRGIFVCDMSDLFGEGIPEAWTAAVLDRIRRSSHRNRYYLLTKQPQNLIKWSPFPENCWVGVTATDTRMALDACLKLGDIEASVRYLSIEPILNPINLPSELLKTCKIGSLIIGQQTPISAKTQPKIEHIQEIVEAADKAGVPVFLKDNLQSLFTDWTLPEWARPKPYRRGLRQEFPKLK